VPERAGERLAGANSLAGWVAFSAGERRIGGRAGQESWEPRPIQRPERLRDAGGPGPLNGFWRDADWIGCTDGKWRPVAPGSFPLVTGHPNRVGLLRGAGNAINKEVAQGFIGAVMDVLAPVDTRRMAETGTGSGRSPGSAVTPKAAGAQPLEVPA
jgi:hypothetical protein